MLRGSLLVRTSVTTELADDSAARLKGFEKDLNLHGNQFATLLSILYVGYIIMQIPSYVDPKSYYGSIGLTACGEQEYAPQ